MFISEGERDCEVVLFDARPVYEILNLLYILGKRTRDGMVWTNTRLDL